MKFKLSALLLAGHLLASASLHAQTFSWAERSGGDAPGVYAAGATTNFAFTWNLPAGTLNGQALTGHCTILRVNSGQTYEGAEPVSSLITAAGFSAPEFDHSPFAVSVGGVNGIKQFVSEGEFNRAPTDAPDGPATVVFTFALDPGQATPANTLIEFCDLGSAENSNFPPSAYAVKATLNGAAVDTTQWTFDVQDPYAPSGNSSRGVTWNGRKIKVPKFLNGVVSGSNFPDTIIFLNTGSTSFDTLTVTAATLDNDAFGVGLGIAPQSAVKPAVSVTVKGDGHAVEGGEGGKLLVRRTGDASSALNVTYSLKGAAQSGIDYEALSGVVSFPAGVSKVKVKVRALTTSPNHGSLKFKLQLDPATDDSYVLTTPSNANLSVDLD